MQKLWEESSSFSNDSDKSKIEQIQLQSETGFLEMRLETASRRWEISQSVLGLASYISWKLHQEYFVNVTLKGLPNERS